MSRLYYLSVLFIWIASCGESGSEDSGLNNLEMTEDSILNVSESEIDTLMANWIFVSDSIGGCLVGNQYCHGSRCLEGCFNRDSVWIEFFKGNRVTLCDFLIKQLADTATTKVHTCPYFSATKGELAVYCLQKLLWVDWYDLDSSYSKYDYDTLIPHEDNYTLQAALQEVLIDEGERENLTNKLENRKQELTSK